jgi:hypothetical protein
LSAAGDLKDQRISDPLQPVIRDSTKV